MPQSPSDWDQPQYYFPTYENDNLLCGLEDQEDSSGVNTSDAGSVSDGSGTFPPVMPEDIPAPVKESILQYDDVRRSLVPQHRSKSRNRRQQ